MVAITTIACKPLGILNAMIATDIDCRRQVDQRTSFLP